MKIRPPLTRTQKSFGLMLHTQSLFMRHFWKDDFSMPMSTPQKLFANTTSRKVILATGRKVAKTLVIEARIIRFGLFQYNKTYEGMFVTNGDEQRKPVWDRVVSRIYRVPLFKMLCLSTNRGDNVLKWNGGMTWMFRIEGNSGDDRNMVGLRCHYIIGDEAQLFHWSCHNSRVQSALPGAKWLYCGVPDGRRDTVFFKIDRTALGSDWAKFKTTTYVNPIYWNIAKRDELRQMYGGQNSPEYITQVLGQWGKEMLSVFPIDSIAIHHEAFKLVRVPYQEIPDNIGETLARARLAGRLQLPRIDESKIIDIGMDYGSRQDPTEIMLAYNKDDAFTDWIQFCRIEVMGADQIQQAYLLQYIVEILGMARMGMICIDLGGPGGGVGSALRRITPNPQFWITRMIDFSANGTIEVRQDIMSDAEEGITRTIKVRRKIWFTQQLQLAMLSAISGANADYRLWLADDEEVIQELEATRQRKMDTGNIQYFPPMKAGKQAVDHNLDAAKALICAISETKAFIGINDEKVEQTMSSDPLFYSNDRAVKVFNAGIPIDKLR